MINSNIKLIYCFSIVIGEIVAQFKFTVLLMPNGPHKITGLPFDPSKCTSTHSIEGKMKVPI